VEWRVKIAQNVVAQNDSADSAQLQTANVTGELTKPVGGNPYSGEKSRDIAISSDGHQTNIKGLVSVSPGEGKVYEAWLQDAGGSEYKLSLGQLSENRTINVSQHMVNPFTYTVFFVTEEPHDDVDPQFS
jgi:anti-sigma-K factor RskA